MEIRLLDIAEFNLAYIKNVIEHLRNDSSTNSLTGFTVIQYRSACVGQFLKTDARETRTCFYLLLRIIRARGALIACFVSGMIFHFPSI